MVFDGCPYVGQPWGRTNLGTDSSNLDRGVDVAAFVSAVEASIARRLIIRCPFSPQAMRLVGIAIKRRNAIVRRISGEIL
jgi:hypothetical protein